jgi:hypothetical protein
MTMTEFIQERVPRDPHEEVTSYRALPPNMDPRGASSDQSTQLLDAWMTKAIELLGYDPRIKEDMVHPNPNAREFWRRWRAQFEPVTATEEMLAPWVDVVVEESEAYDPIVAEHWPTY